ncbi:PASTA domain-containing protein, partial [Streptomyces sp. SID625]|nr:PASTA domain-containing protein [Streptomyces sp. SID625]
RPKRMVLTVVAAVLLVLGVGGGVWYINSGQFTKVPPLLAKTEAQARKRLDAAGLDVKDVKHAYSDTVKRGTVISTDPAAGARIRSNDAVTLTVSDGPETVKVPDLKGRPLDAAQRLLKKAGLEPGMVRRAFSEDVAKGSVIGTDPASGTERHAGSAIALTVSKGSPVDVPDVAGDDLDQARSELEEAGLKVTVASEQVNSEYDKGRVARQSPAAGGQAAEGDTVTLTLSKGPEMIEVPDVTGDSVDDAHKALEDAGFKVSEDRGLLGLFGDTVKKQSVAGGEQAPKGSTIKITIR